MIKPTTHRRSGIRPDRMNVLAARIRTRWLGDIRGLYAANVIANILSRGMTVRELHALIRETADIIDS